MFRNGPPCVRPPNFVDCAPVFVFVRKPPLPGFTLCPGCLWTLPSEGCRLQGGRPWPARNLTSRISARRSALDAQLWTTFSCIVSEFRREPTVGRSRPDRDLQSRQRCGKPQVWPSLPQTLCGTCAMPDIWSQLLRVALGINRPQWYAGPREPGIWALHRTWADLRSIRADLELVRGRFFDNQGSISVQMWADLGPMWR